MIGTISTDYKYQDKHTGHGHKKEKELKFDRIIPSGTSASFDVKIREKNGKITIIASSTLAPKGELIITKKGKKEKTQTHKLSKSSDTCKKIYEIAKQELSFVKNFLG